MPAAVVANISKATLSSGKASQRSKKPRALKRRGRVQPESDDEIEREARTDSDSDEQSSTGSESDFETASDDEHHGGVVTPSTTQSPPPLDISGSTSSVKADAIANGAAGPFVRTTDWAQLVADENATAGGDLPVIDFTEMHDHSIPEPARPATHSRKAEKQGKRASTARSAPESVPPIASESKDEEEPPAEDGPVASSSRPQSKEPSASRARGQSARQAYQERLQQDPAFVPRVGEFWGHDDRLLDKDLRSLSVWWRGRWHNRGRGRGAFSMRGRGGRGGYVGGHAPLQEDQEGAAEDVPMVEDVPAIERAWTHDGFEEMKRREEQRKDEQRRGQGQAQPQAAPQRGTGLRGKVAAVTGRGRGGLARGGHAASPTNNASGAAPAEAQNDFTSRRPWFTMKPEKVWTKHADSFLYIESALRPRPGQGPGVRVKLPGRPAQVLRPQKFAPSAPSVAEVSGAPSHRSDDSERQFVVKLPPRAIVKQAVATAPGSSAQAEPPTTVETDLSIEDVFTVRPHAAPNHTPLGVPGSGQQLPQPLPSEASTPAQNASGLPDPETQRQLEQLGLGGDATSESDGAPSAEIQESLLRNPPAAEVAAPVPQMPDQSRPVPPSLHPLQTSFSPVPQTSPPYGSPYTYAPGLPPGIAMSHQGYPYEVATGRAVYIQPSAPPTMYTPRPVMHPYMGLPVGVPFVPGHMHHPSQEYISHPHTPPINGFIDPSTGVPIFAPARQSSRIEIRAPSDRAESKFVKPAPRPSGLRASVSEAEPAQADGVAREGVDSTQSPPPQHAPADPAMMAYAPYPQQYYYPDPNAYSAYMDMSPQVMPYDLYPQHDQRAHQPVIYY